MQEKIPELPIHLNSTSAYIGIPLKLWTPKLSYLICRRMLQEGILSGTAYIGLKRVRVYSSLVDSKMDGYDVINSCYGWIETDGGLIVDPLDWQDNEDGKYIHHSAKPDDYSYGCDPLNVSASNLPKHYVSDESFNIRRGLHKETFSRLLGYNSEVSGLTMTEVAYLANLPLSQLGSPGRMTFDFLIENKLSKLIQLKHAIIINPQMAKYSPESFLLDK